MPRWGTPETRPATPHVAPPRRQRDLGRSAPWRRTPLPLARSAKAHPSQSLLSARRPRSRGAITRDVPSEGLAYRALPRFFRAHRFGLSRTQGFTPSWYAAPRWSTPETRPAAPHVAPPRRQRDLGRSAPWRRTPLPLARSAKAHPSQSLLSARRPRSRGARTRDAPFEILAYRAMPRSYRTHRLGVSRTQGFTLGWYATPRWGTPETRPAAPHCSHTPRDITLAAAG
jgi:hypothetical protein